MLLYMGFKENLKSELLYQGIYVKDLADKSQISRRTLDNYLREKASDPTAENAVKIANALGVSVEYLVTGSDASVPKSIRPEIIELLNDLKCLSDDDLELVKILIKRLNSHN